MRHPRQETEPSALSAVPPMPSHIIIMIIMEFVQRLYVAVLIANRCSLFCSVHTYYLKTIHAIGV